MPGILGETVVDSFLLQHGRKIVALVLAVLIVLMLNPFHSDLLGMLPTWAYVAPAILIGLFYLLFYLKLQREKTGNVDEVPESGE